MTKRVDYRGFTWVQDGLIYEVVSVPFYHNQDLTVTIDVWNSQKTKIVRRDEALLSKVKEKYEVWLTAKRGK